eukprot:678012-Prymnesium_polylepis.1
MRLLHESLRHAAACSGRRKGGEAPHKSPPSCYTGHRDAMADVRCVSHSVRPSGPLSPARSQPLL